VAAVNRKQFEAILPILKAHDTEGFGQPWITAYRAKMRSFAAALEKLARTMREAQWEWKVPD
jgi:hypothetical protein